jgi:hypothetical protein
MKFGFSILLLACSLTHVAQGTELGPLELEDWNIQLRSESWQPLFVGKNQTPIGMFLANANWTEISDTQSTLAQCGVSLVSRTRTRFSSPPVPHELTIRTDVSKSMVQSLAPIFSRARVDHVSVQILNPRWVRLMSSDTTSLIHSSAIWSNPATRGPIVQCVSEKTKLPLIESVLQADIVVAAKDVRGRNVQIDGDVTSLGTRNFLNGALKSRRNSYSISGVTLARRMGLCVNSLLFFRNPDGGIGAEGCSN